MAYFSWRKRTTADGVLLLLLLLISPNPKLSVAQTSGGDYSTLFPACLATDLCEACLTSISGVGLDAVTDPSSTGGEEAGCTEYQFDEGSVCDRLGVSNYCSAAYSGEDRFTDRATLDYWEGLLGLNGCDTQDMPCNRGEHVFYWNTLQQWLLRPHYFSAQITRRCQQRVCGMHGLREAHPLRGLSSSLGVSVNVQISLSTTKFVLYWYCLPRYYHVCTRYTRYIDTLAKSGAYTRACQTKSKSTHKSHCRQQLPGK